MNIVAIYRAERFSPNSVDRDKAILDEVCQNLGSAMSFGEEKIDSHVPDIMQADVVLSMARGKKALNLLMGIEHSIKVVNSATAIFHCSRSNIDCVMRENNIPAAPLFSEGRGWWIKRGDEAAQQKDDVVFAESDAERDTIVGRFMQRGITDVVVTAHVVGDLLKFYGVVGTNFFHVCYPTDGGFSKFGNEMKNGEPRHTAFSIEALRNDATRLAAKVGIDVYGGDCIVREDGSYAIIDFNDWPSFSSCRKNAAMAIAQLVKTKVKG